MIIRKNLLLIKIFQKNIKHPEYYSSDLRLEGYVYLFRGIVSKTVGYVFVQNFKHNLIIWERFLPSITKFFKKLLILFHTSNKRRIVQIFFPGDIADIYFTSEVFDKPLTEYFKEEKLRQIILTLTDKILRLNVFNRYNNTKEKITFHTTMGTILDCYLNNPDVIAVWLCYYTKLEIISLLFKDNENDGYVSDIVESNIPKDNNDESNTSEDNNNKKRKPNPIFLLAKNNSNSSIKPTANSNLHFPTPYVFKKNPKNYENVNDEELQNLRNRLKELESLNLKDQLVITDIGKNMNIRKNEIKEISKQIEMYTKQEILLPPPKEKTNEEIEDEMEADLLRFRYLTYQPNTSYKGKENDLFLQKEKKMNLI
jgi:hypothetical protein